MRKHLTAWLGAWGQTPVKEGYDLGNHRFNIVDVAKSYIGGTQCGIVLDLKVGPSLHLLKYTSVFKTKFVSYSRGLGSGNTPDGMPENQCMGTMEKSGRLRGIYALYMEEYFENKEGTMLESYDGKWFNKITQFHWRSWAKMEKDGGLAFNVSRQPPLEIEVESAIEKEKKELGDVSGVTARLEAYKKIMRKDYLVREMGVDPNYGPFRVFKDPGEQSHRGDQDETEEEEERRLAPAKRKVFELCKDTYKKELSVPKKEGHERIDPFFSAKIEKLLEGWKPPRLW